MKKLSFKAFRSILFSLLVFSVFASFNTFAQTDSAPTNTAQKIAALD